MSVLNQILYKLSDDFLNDLYYDRCSNNLKNLNEILLLSRADCKVNLEQSISFSKRVFPNTHMIYKKDISDITIVKDNSLSYLLKNPDCIDSIPLWKIVSEKLQFDVHVQMTIKDDEVKNQVLKSWIKNEMNTVNLSKIKNKDLSTIITSKNDNFDKNLVSYKNFTKDIAELKLDTKIKNNKLFVTYKITK